MGLLAKQALWLDEYLLDSDGFENFRQSGKLTHWNFLELQNKDKSRGILIENGCLD
jgi:hypothetical protein